MSSRISILEEPEESKICSSSTMQLSGGDSSFSELKDIQEEYKNIIDKMLLYHYSQITKEELNELSEKIKDEKVIVCPKDYPFIYEDYVKLDNKYTETIIYFYSIDRNFDFQTENYEIEYSLKYQGEYIKYKGKDVKYDDCFFYCSDINMFVKYSLMKQEMKGFLTGSYTTLNYYQATIKNQFDIYIKKD